MTYLLVCALVFLAAYALVIVTTSIGFHRGLCHGALEIHPLARTLLLRSSVWITGIDPKVWVVMHRTHHLHSDTKEDPHSPKNMRNVVSMFFAQMVGYDAVNQGLRRGDEKYTSLGKDLEMSWPASSGFWLAPYLLHLVLAVALGYFAGWLLALALFGGLICHAFQGVIINYFGHSRGPRNFDTPDDARNNHFGAWILLGEGFQNNHHQYPASARFSYRPSEVDFGYAVCLMLQALGIVTVNQATLMPRLAAVRASA